MSSSVVIIGAGLAGCECAMALAARGLPVVLYEMKPGAFSPAHTSADFAELVCSNSFRSDEPENAVGLLKEEMRALGSLVMDVAGQTRVPAGKALAVDRERFAAAMTQRIMETPNITVVRREVTALDDAASLTPEGTAPRAVVVAAGPLASDALSQSLAALTGGESLYFYDAIAPIILTDSVNMDIAFWGARYNPEDSDYLNCPMEKDEYFAFYEALLAGEKVAAREFEKETHFEGCMPIEALAERGPRTLAFGPLKPVGFTDPRTGRRPYALLQLRLENLNKSTVNMVGCQTKLTYGAQAEIFRLIPGLEKAEFARFGSMHRNTFVNAPKVLGPDLSLKGHPGIYLAGQITGVEGYVESAANGLWLGLSLAAALQGKTLPPPPETTAMGSLLRHLQTPVKHFQPSNVQYGLMPELGERIRRDSRKAQYAARGRAAFEAWCRETA
ncbi:Methylenetetrahydrofolate--tRNA-(uracil-5-)-methyltransferase TrmFO [uncultured delta proteobacterium]|uniref:Methylenetetrahydrofolate--tRNA-(uracil-5-)-methyltransferase TrmFO n=1 Tax=uncultured delta proteobacterium TaxID=34034 RepID=A0A212JDQ6_9DELT|nr:Methylenetetrahydrofolate--tRNA-(uracil-5-)-methyltransferase TrmFO [uncultured delta proteobacterium]